MNILGQARLNSGIVAIGGETFYTKAYIARKFNKHPNTIKYYQHRMLIPDPEIFRYKGGFIYLWSSQSLKIIENNLSKISYGRYKGDKHPILGKVKK